MMQNRVRWMLWFTVLGSLALTTLGVCVGSVGFENLLQPLLSGSSDPESAALARQIVWEIRLPRTVGAWAAGALLGLAGAVAQGLFRNPLADPYLLGSASGASLGVALALAAMGGAAGMLGGGAPQSSLAMMMSGLRRTISALSAMMRCLPACACASSGKQSSPPAMPSSSDTQRMALMGGSSHSSK